MVSQIRIKGTKYSNGLYLTEMYKPSYIGSSILDLGKICMKFHDGVFEKEFENRHELLDSDTDNLVYNVRHPDVYAWIKK